MFKLCSEINSFYSLLFSLTNSRFEFLLYTFSSVTFVNLKRVKTFVKNIKKLRKRINVL